MTPLTSLRYSVCVLLLLFGSAAASSAQAPSAIVQGPIVGFVSDPAGETIQPILGILSASVLGPPIDLGVDVRKAAISPGQDYAIGIRKADSAAVLIRLAADSVTVSPLNDIQARTETIALSATGKAAALYDSETRTLQTIRNVSETLEVGFQFDAREIPGDLVDAAVSDDGMLALLRFANSDERVLWLVGPNGLRWTVPAKSPSASAFLPDRHDVVIGDDMDQQVFLLTNVDESAERVPVAASGEGFDGISGVAASADGQRILITSKTSANVTIANLETKDIIEIPCYCRASGLRRMNASSAFLLETEPDAPAVLLDAAAPQPRIVIIPRQAEKSR